MSASVDAVNRNDFAAFDRAELAKRTGAPVADVPVTAAAVDDPAKAGEPKLSRKERDQLEANDRTRKAVDAATADLRAEVERLKAGAAAPRSDAPPAPAAPAPPATKGTPEYKRLMALPDAPKLEDYDSVAEHAFAAAEFIDTTRTKERETAARSRASQDALFASEKAADDAFFGQLEQAKTADPEFTKKVAPEVLGLTPVEWVPRDAHGRPLDKPLAEGGRPIQLGPLHVVASELRKSPVVRDLMLHFSQHPADLAKFAELPPAVAAIADPRARLHAHVAHIVREFHRLEGRFTAVSSTTDTTTAPAAPAADTVTRSPITAAPPPPPTLRAAGATSDPKAAALARGDFEEFDRLEVQERMAKLAPAR